MNNAKRHSLLYLIVIGLLLIFSACSNEADADSNSNVDANENNNNKDDEEGTVIEGIQEPVTIRISVGIEGEDFEEKYKEPAEEHFPNLTLELIPFAPDKNTIEEEMMKGNIPDIIYGNNLEQIRVYEEYELLLDQTELIQKHNLDIDLFNHGFLQMIRSYAGGDELWALPIDMTRYALHYNKDIFDLFGEDYPEDGMTWQEVIDLSKRVSGEINGMEYTGLQLPVPRILLSTLPVPLVDPETDEPLFATESVFTELFQLYEQVYGNQDIEPDLTPVAPFIGDRNLAMAPTFYLYSDWTGLKTATEQGMGWDIATFPLWDDNEKYTPMVGGRWMAVTDTSEHKDAAFQVLKFLLSKDEIGSILEGPVSIPFNSEATAEYIAAAELDEGVADKNIDALFSHPTLEKQSERSVYEATVQDLLVDHINEFISPENRAGKDINTAIRELQEAAEISILEEQTKQ